ncbi:MAG: TIGR01777 family oxidoreductase [Rickettsiales bacterium]|nr:TIGR01777 family oxidoreductase [Pseudomonadota bacterium]MDA0966198.1 TIGR01777 family oxidoreductase [Pseudomonadota bacterium]MDG4543137.1 TIGR01777 family oxidoreductase [Rickettsiales bacterium]MDG4545335.1 TIGR01777 family oxidoreductase [Rickettsiales bacterium]MDG4547784.1 TIGR01777 family oxidoreductase [Rickettsiales bacterium]
MRILITGGTGFIGKACTKFLTAKEHEVIILTRSKDKAPLYAKVISEIDEIKKGDKIDVIINLAGAPIDKRWTTEYKNELISSRVDITGNVISLIERLKTKPKLLISASAIGYYGCQGGERLVEKSAPVTNFTHELCKTWEDEALKAKNYGVRVCIARLGVVFGIGGGMIEKVLPSFKSGLGKKLGDGNQYLSWVHLHDVVRAFNFFIKHDSCSGIYNVTAPNPVTNEQFTTAMNDTLHLPTFLFIPAVLIKLIYGEMGETLLLQGQYVIPKKLLDEDFRFNFNTVEEALSQILENRKQL